MPNDGPLLSTVISEREQQDGFVYGLVDLNTTSVKALEKHDYYPLSSHFGLGKASPGSRIGVGDILNITIFEAGPDGIFSTAEKKSVNLNLTVQQNGRISIPFDGTVLARGRTLEQIRRAIIGQLKGRAVEPDVIVNVAEVRSQSVVVNGDVNAAKSVPLINGRERLLDVIGMAGGPSKAPYDTYVSVSRNNATRTALVQTLIDKPSENIYVRPEDAIYLSYDPRTFMAFGAVSKKGRYPFGSANLSLIEAAAMAGGLDDTRANPGAYFVFRYEYDHVIKHLIENYELDADAVYQMLENPNIRDDKGRLPIVYRIDLNDPDNFFVAKRFPVRAGDTIYVSRQPIVDFAKFVTIVRDTATTARAVHGLK